MLFYSLHKFIIKFRILLRYLNDVHIKHLQAGELPIKNFLQLQIRNCCITITKILQFIIETFFNRWRRFAVDYFLLKSQYGADLITTDESISVVIEFRKVGSNYFFFTSSNISIVFNPCSMRVLERRSTTYRPFTTHLLVLTSP